MVVEFGTDTLYEQFEYDHDVICAVDRDLRISYCNRAWEVAALENNAQNLLRCRGVGESILEAISPCLRDFYGAHFRHVIEYKRPWHQFYLCSSARLLREFKMVLEPLPEDGVLARHTLIAEKPHPFPALPGSHHYFDERGKVWMCAHCRFTERQDGSGRWDWVPDFVEHQPMRLDYVLCRLCARHFELTRVASQFAKAV